MRQGLQPPGAGAIYLPAMAKRRSPALPLPTVMAELFCASAETILRRSWMMSCGTCSPAEFSRMWHEKMLAAQEATVALATSLPVNAATAAVAPWHRRATANARRLRRRKG